MNNIVQQGSFAADGTAKTLKIRSGIDRLEIVNATQHAAANNGYGVEYVWQKGMGTGSRMFYRPAANQTLASNISAASINVIDTSNYAVGTRQAVTGGTNVAAPVYSTADTTGLLAGGIVRLDNTAHTNLNGLDFSVSTVNANTNFLLGNTLATAPSVVAGAAGFYKTIAPNIEIYRMFTPSNRNIADVSVAASAIVTTLVDHGYAVGQRVKFSVPALYGMTQLDGLTGNITAVTAGPPNTFTVDIDSSAFTAFTFPVTTSTPFVHASVVPVGDNPGYASYMTAPGAFYNQAFTGVVLAGGTTGPGGNAGDTVYWTAYKTELS